MSASGGICASVFLIVSMLFILMVHVNGLVYQVSEEPLFLLLFLPIPVIFSVGSVAWLFFSYKGAQEGGYPVYIEDLSMKLSTTQAQEVAAEEDTKSQKSE